MIRGGALLLPISQCRMNNKGVKTPAVLPWIPGGVDKKDSRNKYVHKKSEGRIRFVVVYRARLKGGTQVA